MRRCPGCGLTLPEQELPSPDGFRASPECWGLCGELTAYAVSRRDPSFSHQYAVDAYAAQHADPAAPPIRTAFALIGLCLAVEHGFTGRDVQRAHMAIGRRRHRWPRLDAPEFRWTRTVRDALAAEPGAPRDAAVRAWVEDAWDGWSPQHAWVREVCRRWLEEGRVR